MRKLLTCAVLLVASYSSARAVTLEQSLSRENPLYSCRDSELTIGRDGMVYLHSRVVYNGYVLRLTREGKEKTGGDTGPATGNVAVNANGVIAAANEHFASAVGFYDKEFTHFADVDEFPAWTQELGEGAGYSDPARVEAGQSGDFYALDQLDDVIVRMTPVGKAIKKYRIPRDGTEKNVNVLSWDFRMSEKAGLFYASNRNKTQIRGIDFDGQEKWKTPVNNTGGWDVDDGGTLYVIAPRADAVQKFDIAGKPAGELKLTGNIADEGDFKTAVQKYPITSMRVFGNEIFVKRQHPTEMFLRFDAASGELKQAITTDHETLTVNYPSEVWTAGQGVDFSITHADPILHAKPQWHVWARGLSTADYREFKVVDGKLQVPADAAGIYQIKVTPEVEPWERGTPSEYSVQAWVEVRSPGSQGTANVFTPENRVSFARGEAAPFAVLLRTGANGQGAALPVDVRLSEQSGKAVLAQVKTTAKPGESVSFTLAPSLTAALTPGRYWLSATSPGLTTISQPIVIGDATLQKSPWLNVQYGDYEQPGFFPGWEATVWTAPDHVAAHVQRTHKLGVNLVVERLGHNAGAVSGNSLTGQLADLRTRLTADAQAVAPEKAAMSNALLQTMAGFGANGISQMSILLYMDTNLPIGKGNDTPEKITERISTVTNGLKPYLAYRGWSWVANWWIWDPSVAYADAAEKTAYEAALKKAQETGEWNPVLDKVGDKKFSYGVDAEKQFHTLLDQLSPGKISALSGPYRSIATYPPVSFAGANEVDLQYQAEQIQPPNTIWHNVDYQKRPGKKAWGHPELWNDNGTGAQILPGLFGMAMRGVDGVGLSGKIPFSPNQPEDPRSSNFGTTSVWRATFKLFNHYGPWLQTMQPNDHVAIVVSARMAKIDNWKGVGGEYFSRLFEAYQSCLYSHRPASYVFFEDLKPTTLQNYSAVIVAGQTVEFEPALLAALQNAKAKGIPVLADGTSRESLVKEFTPIGIAFDKIANDPSVWQDDAAQWRFADCFVSNAPIVAKALDKVVPPAETVAPQVLLTERRAENARYLWVINNTVPAREPGELWRVSKAITTRDPIEVAFKPTASGNAIYDVFAMKQVTPQNGSLTADLRTLPGRLYAILPAAIDRIALRGPGAPVPGLSFKWWLQARDAADKPVAASVPVRLRLLSGNNVVEERYVAAGGAGIAGNMVAPLNASNLTLEATELLSGKTTGLALKMGAAALPVGLDKPLAAQEVAANASGTKLAPKPDAAEEDFGIHARDVIVSADDSTAVVTAMNLGDNLFGLDVTTGKLKWQDRYGEHFAYAPQRLTNGFAVEGFDFKTPEGYHLYLAGNDGKPTRRFALYGLPKGGVNWAFGGWLMDTINNFATAPDGSWVASAGDLGLVAWSKAGNLLWSQDWSNNRHAATLTALGANTLVVGEGSVATAYNAQNGKQEWQIKLGAHGQILEGKASRDGRTIVLRTDVDTGRVFVVSSGKIVTSFLTKSDDAILSDDSTILVLTVGNLLKVYGVGSGLKWTYGADDRLHFPRLSPDGKRIVVCSEIGTVTVLGMDGTVLHSQDVESLAAPAWLASGDLLLATWNGTVTRLNTKYGRVWQSRLKAQGAAPLAADAPTTRITTWTNTDAKPSPLTPNLLADTKALFSVTLSDRAQELKNKTELLTDGKTDAPAQPWVSWSSINMVESGWHGEMAIIFDNFRTQIRLTGITLVEDPQHPESWLRDANLEYWDPIKEKWIFGASLLSNSATHTHTLAKPIEACKFRLVKSVTPGVWPVGNIRLEEVVFHGQALGGSHPDIIAKNPRAVLFDEGDDLMKVLVNVAPKLDDAFSGGRSLKIEGGRNAAPQYVLPFGHAVPGWNFPIRENPGPGEYRWLQFAWKALSPQTTGMMMLIGNPFPGPGVSLVAGDYKGNEGVLVEKKMADTPPTEWKTVRVDMWDLTKKPLDIQCMLLGAHGGAVAFDQIVLGRTEADLPSQK